jgi:hypothetical protein
MSGRLHQDEFDGNDKRRAVYESAARRAGVNPTGKKYLASLAGFQRDPEAWVGGDDDVKRVCKKRGWGCEGSITVVQPKVELLDPGKYRAADSLVELEVNRITGGESVGAKERADLKEATATRLGGNP